MIGAPPRLTPATRSSLNLLQIINAIWGQIAVSLCALTGIRILTELLPVNEFGYAMTAMGGVAFIDGVLIMAFNQTLLSLCGHLDDPEEQRSVSAGLAFRLLRVVNSSMLLLLTIAALWCLLIQWNSIAIALPIIVAVYISSEVLKTSMLSPLIANRKYFRYSLWITGEAALQLAITTLGLKVFGPSVYVYLLSLVTSRILSTSTFFIAYFKGCYFKDVNTSAASRSEARALQYGWPVSLMAPLGWSATYLDRYILFAVGGAALAGVYSASVSLVARPFAMTTSVLTNYFRPQLYRSEVGSISTGIRWKVQTMWIVSALAIGLLGTVAYALLGTSLASLLLADEYRSNVTSLLVIVSLGQTFTIMTHAVDNGILSTGESATLLKTQLALIVVSLLLVPLGTLWLGGRGAALGRGIAECIKFGCSLAVAYRLLRLSTEQCSSSAPVPTEAVY
jgi:hypothetical protein